MSNALLARLRDRLEGELEGLVLEGDGLRARADARFGDVVLEIDHDEEAESIRVSVAVPPAAGAGPDFLVFLLSTNTQYWDVKVGIDDDGRLVVHSDLELDEEPHLDELSAEVMDRAETILELLDDDITEWLLARGLGAPAQLARWRARPMQRD